ncbi:MAG: hypothetical protein WAV73_06325 [Candidatus Moraniibacteriota bacterium]
MREFRLLIIEGCSGLGKVTAQKIKGVFPNCQIDIVDSAERAFQAVKNIRYDVVMSFFYFGDDNRNGVDVLFAVKKQYPKIGTILLLLDFKGGTVLDRTKLTMAVDHIRQQAIADEWIKRILGSLLEEKKFVQGNIFHLSMYQRQKNREE